MYDFTRNPLIAHLQKEYDRRVDKHAPIDTPEELIAHLSQALAYITEHLDERKYTDPEAGSVAIQILHGVQYYAYLIEERAQLLYDLKHKFVKCYAQVLKETNKLLGYEAY